MTVPFHFTYYCTLFLYLYQNLDFDHDHTKPNYLFLHSFNVCHIHDIIYINVMSNVQDFRDQECHVVES